MTVPDNVRRWLEEVDTHDRDTTHAVARTWATVSTLNLYEAESLVNALGPEKALELLNFMTPGPSHARRFLQTCRLKFLHVLRKIPYYSGHGRRTESIAQDEEG